MQCLLVLELPHACLLGAHQTKGASQHATVEAFALLSMDAMSRGIANVVTCTTLCTANSRVKTKQRAYPPRCQIGGHHSAWQMAGLQTLV